MKLIYSEIKKFLPSLNIEPAQMRDDLTMIGHFTNFFEEIDNEIVFDLDIKVNRGDCLGYYGLARDLSILYQIPLVLPNQILTIPSGAKLPITVTSSDVYRLQAVKLTNINNTPSPEWLKKILNLHQINCINCLVDITNYIAITYGIPCHAFDTAKSTDNLIWENNDTYKEFISLDGTKIELQPQNLLITDNTKVLSLAFIGGQNSGVDLNTSQTIIEMAIYNPSRVRLDSRFSKITTDASIRLEKQLDPEIIPLAFSYLIKMIQDLTHAQIGSGLFDYYPHPIIAPAIEFNPDSPSIVSGIDIPKDFAQKIVDQVGSRKDLNMEADLVEEVVRFFGYHKIPTNQPLTKKDVPDITPKILYLIDQLKDKLVSEGYDEVLTWPLVVTPIDPKTAISTQNSINSESTYLRQSLIPSLKAQLGQYNRYKLPQPKFFEIGKIYHQENSQYIERYALGKYDGVNFSEEILDDMPKPDFYTPQMIRNLAFELTGQIIALDANVISDQSPEILLKHYQSIIDPNILWQISITDHFQNKYTFRVYYYNCDDKTAKKTHLAVFNLNC